MYSNDIPLQVLVMIDGQCVKNFEFKNCVLKTL